MDENIFEKLLAKITHRITKMDTQLRMAITDRAKLIVTLRYLATGESFVSLKYNYRISDSAISKFIPIVCEAIYEELKNEYLNVSKLRRHGDVCYFCMHIITIENQIISVNACRISC